MRKGTSALQNVQVLKWCKELGLTSHWNLLYGFPGEDPEEYERMAALLPALHHLDPPGGCGRIRLDRFSPYFVEAERFGLCNVRPTQAYRFIYDLSESELANLAYYFDYDYADGHDPESYTERTRDEVGRWLAGFGGDDEPSLTYQDDGAILVIRDSRAAPAPGVTRLVGEEREIYLYCDQNRSQQQVRTFARSLGRADGNADVLLRRLVDRRLMVEADGRYLSLAVSADEGPASPCRTGAAFGSITPNAVVASTPGRRRKQYERERGQHKERNTRGVHRQASGIS
jgi:hypothetical protein